MMYRGSAATRHRETQRVKEDFGKGKGRKRGRKDGGREGGMKKKKETNNQ